MSVILTFAAQILKKEKNGVNLAAREEAVTAGTTAQYTQAFSCQFSQWGDGR